ncbi:MAG: hypothetical protein OHK93_006683 [Ramalina farinacea]|uniref:Cytochrome b561 domain-containing protein n=1 Tax=Ramalina farinacea TaxID=258253 RepID=A0AA43TTB7_9LECA|nr:hypothetical protein [Ramalina farinacea]
MSTNEENPAPTQSSDPSEPLLGRAGDASQQEGKGLEVNFVLGTGIIAQAGIWVLLNSAGLLLTVEAILLLQPTHTPKQKRQGANAHAVLNTTSLVTLIAALIVIEANKFKGGAAHLYSPHAILGLITYILFFLQAIVGIAQLYIPALFGGEENAKKVYKYHRMSGYFIVLMTLATICAATQTSFNVGAIHIKLWAMIVLSLVIVGGLAPRIKKNKLGL